MGGRCDFLAQSINYQYYIRSTTGDTIKLKEAVIKYCTSNERQKVWRRILAKTGNNGPNALREESNQPQRGQRYNKSQSPYNQRHPTRKPSSVQGLAKSASAGSSTPNTFQEDDMPHSFDDSNILSADDERESYYDEGNMDESNHE